MLKEQLSILKKESGLTTEEISKISGIPKSTLSKLFDGTRENPTYHTLKAMVHAMGGSLADLDPLHNEYSTYDERKLLDTYRSLSAEGQRLLKHTLTELVAYETQRTRQLSQKTTSLPLYLLSASAGVGSYLDSELYDFHAFPEDIIPPNTKFAIRVLGDSMEPAFSSDDLVFVQPTQHVREGDVVILTINGDGYIKQLRKNSFHSFNPKYDPICPSEFDTVRIIGKVLGKYQES